MIRHGDCQHCHQPFFFLKEHMKTFSLEDWALVFVSFKEGLGQQLAEALGCNFYYAVKDEPNHIREAKFLRWLEGGFIVICTNSFGDNKRGKSDE